MLCWTRRWNLVYWAALGSWSHYCWTQAFLDALGAPSKKMGYSHTSPMATQVLQHRCDQWASMDAGIVRQDSPMVSWPQAILKFGPPSSLHYKACHRPQTIAFSMWSISVLSSTLIWLWRGMQTCYFRNWSYYLQFTAVKYFIQWITAV